MSEQAAVDKFKKIYRVDPDVVAIAPGRINLIGEHTDYNDGFVFPAAIDKRVYVAAQLNESEDSSELESLETGKSQPFNARCVKPGDVKGWGSYAAGMAWVLRETTEKPVPNIRAIVSGDVPIGSGVSSSAALELAFGVLWKEVAGIDISMPMLALLAQENENEFVGVKCGIMDQMASAMGRAGHAMFLDTRSLEIKYAPMPGHLSVVICDTGKPRALTDSAYNERRSQCEEASRILDVKALRDADMAALDRHRTSMDDVVYRRAKHVISENARCVRFERALSASSLGEIGLLMRASHESLRDDYEVSSKELDIMAETAGQGPGCIGARMTGAGFGGACVAVVETERLEDFKIDVSKRYRERSSIDGEIIACKLADGARAFIGARSDN
jgi:galactokinase